MSDKKRPLPRRVYERSMLLQDSKLKSPDGQRTVSVAVVRSRAADGRRAVIGSSIHGKVRQGGVP